MRESPRLFDFVVIGAMKAGTTWVDELLRSHPDVCLPAGTKETFFLDRYWQRGPDWYRRKYLPAGRSCQAVGEVAATYLDHPLAPARLEELGGASVVIAVLRDPVERAVSHVRHLQYRGDVPQGSSVREAIERRPEVLTAGEYGRHLAHWSTYVERDHLVLLRFDDLRADRAAFARQVCDAVGLDAERLPAIPGPAYERSVARGHVRAKAASIASRSLHRAGLHGVVRKVRTSPVRGLVADSGGSDIVVLSEGERRWLSRFYTADLERLRSDFGQAVAAGWVDDGGVEVR